MTFPGEPRKFRTLIQMSPGPEGRYGAMPQGDPEAILMMKRSTVGSGGHFFLFLWDRGAWIPVTDETQIR